jgi:cytidylate kinase
VTAIHTLPKLITFDGEARSGKGTIVQATKDALRDEYDFNVMLIDAGQVFRCLVVAASNAGVDVDSPADIDTFLGDDASAEACVTFVKDVYHMPKEQRDLLLYTNQVGADSAKIGARPLSQSFKDELLKKWLRDAAAEGYDIVLLDGRALEETGKMLEREGLCEFIIGLYFTCDAIVGARRTLGHAARSYDELTSEQRAEVDLLVTQIDARNDSDRTRSVQPIVPPADAPVFRLPDVQYPETVPTRFMATIDTSADLSKDAMSAPVIALVSSLLTPDK